MKISALLGTLGLLLLSGVSFAQAAPSAALSYAAPTTNTDGSAITAPLSYNIYQGLTGALVKVQSAVAGLSVTITTGLTAGTTQCFAVTAVENGVEGAQSNTACVAIPKPVPGVPTQVTIVLH
jgi:hypothetical protein